MSAECEVAHIGPSNIGLPVHVKADRWRETIVENGMEVVEDPDRASFRTTLEPLYETYHERFGDLMDKIEDQ